MGLFVHRALNRGDREAAAKVIFTVDRALAWVGKATVSARCSLHPVS